MPRVVIKNDVMKFMSDAWRELCIAAAFEDNPERLTELVAEINKQLMDRQEALTDQIFERLAQQNPAVIHQKNWIQ